MATGAIVTFIFCAGWFLLATNKIDDPKPPYDAHGLAMKRAYEQKWKP